MLVISTDTGTHEWRESEKKVITKVEKPEVITKVEGELVADDYGSIDWANRTWEKGEKALQEANDCRYQLVRWLDDFRKQEGISLTEAVKRKADEGFKANVRTVNNWFLALPEYKEEREEKKNNPSKAAEKKRKQREKKKGTSETPITNVPPKVDSRENSPSDHKVAKPSDSEEKVPEIQIEKDPVGLGLTILKFQGREHFSLPESWKSEKTEPELKGMEELPDGLKNILDFDEADVCWTLRDSSENVYRFVIFSNKRGDCCGLLFDDYEPLLFLNGLSDTELEGCSGDKVDAYLNPSGDNFVWRFLRDYNFYAKINPIDFDEYQEDIFSDLIEVLKEPFVLSED